MKMKPPRICDIDPSTFEVTETEFPSVPLPKWIEICLAEGPQLCLGDCNGDGVVNFSDLTAMFFAFGNPVNARVECDANQDGVINFNDLTTTLFLFGPCP